MDPGPINLPIDHTCEHSFILLGHAEHDRVSAEVILYLLFYYPSFRSTPEGTQPYGEEVRSGSTNILQNIASGF